MRRIVLMFLANFFRLPYLLYMILKYGKKEKYDKHKRYALIRKGVTWANHGGHVVIDCHGLENLPDTSGYIMFPNHQGLYDVLSLIEVIEAPFSPIMKVETQNIILLKRVADLLDAEFIDRDDIRQSLKVIRTMSERVKQGDNFVIFPEGTRSRLGNELLEFKAGCFKSAMMAKCPIVPVALIDSFIPFDKPSLKKTTVHVHFLKPLLYNEYKDMKSHEIAERVSSYIKETIKNNTPSLSE